VKAPIDWEYHEIYTKAINEAGDLIKEESLNAVINYKWGLKGIISAYIQNDFQKKKQTLFKLNCLTV